MLWVESYPLKRYVAVLTSIPQDVALYGNRVVADVISLDEVMLE